MRNQKKLLEIRESVSSPLAPALQIGTHLYRIQKKNKNGSIRLICTDERFYAYVAMYDNKIKFMRGIHRHEERVLTFHVEEMVCMNSDKAVNDLRAPFPQI